MAPMIEPISLLSPVLIEAAVVMGCLSIMYILFSGQAVELMLSRKRGAKLSPDGQKEENPCELLPDSPNKVFHSVDVHAGTVFATGTSPIPVYESTASWHIIGTLPADHQAVASGPLVFAEGYAMVPISYPTRGAVELTMLQALTDQTVAERALSHHLGSDAGTATEDVSAEPVTFSELTVDETQPETEVAKEVDTGAVAQEVSGSGGTDVKNVESVDVAEADFNIEIVRRAGSKVGLELGVDWSCRPALLIKSIKVGLVEEWNQNHADAMVHVGDRIVDINGARHDAVKMLAEIKNEGTLKISLQRRAQAEGAKTVLGNKPEKTLQKEVANPTEPAAVTGTAAVNENEVLFAVKRSCDVAPETMMSLCCGPDVEEDAEAEMLAETVGEAKPAAKTVPETGAKPGAESNAPNVRGCLPVAANSVSADISERTVKEWLQRFANDGDTEALSCQWRAWGDGHTDSASRVVGWLLKRGLDDCMLAGAAPKVIKHLLHVEGLSVQLLEQCRAMYSDEDLADLKLDNPKVDDFVMSIDEVLAEMRSMVSKMSSCPASSVEVAELASCVPPCYSREILMSARRLSLCDEGRSDDTTPRWRAEADPSICESTPSWRARPAQDSKGPCEAKNEEARMLRIYKGSSEFKGSIQGILDAASCEWRGEPQKQFESRKGASEGKGKKSVGRLQEAIQASETSWVAGVKRWKGEKVQQTSAEVGSLVDDQQFLREMRLTLNKLTVEKFDNLSNHLIQMISKSKRPNHGIPVLVQMVFEKATAQHHFIDMYVSLCVKLHQWLGANEHVVSMHLENNFKRILLNQCQSSFEHFLEPPDGFDGLIGDELYEAQVKYKTKMLGNIKLVGQLLRHGMLASKMTISIAVELMRDDPIVLDERLETLAVFLEAVGPSLDNPAWALFTELDAIFSKVKRLAMDTTVPSRIRFLLRDVLDLRNSSWQAQKVRLFDATPTTIADVHQKAKEDQDVRPNATTKAKGANKKCCKGQSSREWHRASAKECKPPVALLKPDDVLRRALKSPKLALRPSASLSSPVAVSKRTRKPTPLAPVFNGGGDSATPEVSSGKVAQPAPRDERPREEMLACFHKEVVHTLRHLGDSLDVAVAVERLSGCPLPPDCVIEETVDVLARVVDEPRLRRERLLPLLAQVFSAGVMFPPRLLVPAVEAFATSAFADLGSVDPPNLADIMLQELLPALGLAPGTLKLPECFKDLMDGGATAH